METNEKNDTTIRSTAHFRKEIKDVDMHPYLYSIDTR